MTCWLALIDLVASWVICNDCMSHSLETSLSTMRLLYIKIKGVANIDNTMLAKIGCSKWAGTSAFSWARVSNTKPNSPACAKYKPVRTATPDVAPNRRAKDATMTALNSSGTTNSNKTKGHCAMIMRQSSIMPMLIKKIPKSTS